MCMQVYKNERHVPMWYCGYEGEQMREAFRVCSGLRDIGSWPSDQFRERWTALTVFLQNLCDQCLGILLDKDIRVSLAMQAHLRSGGGPDTTMYVKPTVCQRIFLVLTCFAVGWWSGVWGDGTQPEEHHPKFSPRAEDE